MDGSDTFRELSDLLRRAGITIRTEPFQTPPDSAGGLCYVFGKQIVLLDKNASIAERVRALLEVVERIGLDSLGVTGSDLSPSLLSALNRRGQMAWPHKSEAPALAKTEARAKSRVRLVPAPLPLRLMTSMQLGGSPDELITAISERQIIEAAERAAHTGAPLHVLGGGSNVVVADAGVRGIVLAVQTEGISIERKGNRARVTAQAGENWHEFVRRMTDLGFAGVECLAGIPGNVGATPIQNVGAYGQQVDSTIENVRVLCRRSLEIKDLDNQSCEFSYRSSVFKTREKDRFIVLSVTFDLSIDGTPTVSYGELQKHLAQRTGPSAAPTLRDVFDAVMMLRRKKSMVLDPDDENGRSCGSFFVNAIIEEAVAERISELVGEKIPTFPITPLEQKPTDARFVKVPSAWLIEKAGLNKGFRLGNAGLSTRHTLCVVAHPGATSQDVIAVARHVRKVVEDKLGVRLVPEPHFWGFPDLEDGLPA